MSIQGLCPFLNQVLLLLSCRSSLYILHTRSLSNIWFTNILSTLWVVFSLKKKHFIYLLFREGTGRRKRGRDTSVCERYSHWLPLTPPTGDLATQPRHVPWLGIEPATFLFTGWHSVHWTTPAGASTTGLIIVALYQVLKSSVNSPTSLSRLLVSQGPLQLYMNFWMEVSIFAKKVFRLLIGIAVTIDYFGEYCHVNNVKSFSPWTQDVFPFI